MGLSIRVLGLAECVVAHHSMIVFVFVFVFLPSLRWLLQLRCAGLVSSWRCPPRASGIMWSRVKALACVGGRVMSMGFPHSQHTARSGFRSSRCRCCFTYFFHRQSACCLGMWCWSLFMCVAWCLHI